MKGAALLLLLLWPASTLGQFAPLAQVTGVAADDTLNVRSGPDVSFPIVGTLASNETHVNTFGRAPVGENTWIEVSKGESLHGWVSVRFIEPMELPSWGGAYAVPEQLVCSGWEPGWALTLLPDQQIEVIEPGADGIDTLYAGPAEPISSPFGPLVLRAKLNKDEELIATVSQGQCYSAIDAPYAYSATLSTPYRQHHGCCHLPSP